MTDLVNSISNISSGEDNLFSIFREKGIEYLQKIAETSWTDHNSHDPGITILEALCYVMSEFSNQLDFPIEDIIASLPDINESKLALNFPSAGNAIPNNAITITDFRKLIVDLPEVRNAYLEITKDSTISVYYDNTTKLLTYEPGSEVQALNWGGLYLIQIEFENDDLNSNLLFDKITVIPGGGNPPKMFNFSVSFHYWDTLSIHWFLPITVVAVALENPIVTLDETEYEDYYAEIKIEFSDGTVVSNFPVWIKLIQPIDPSDPINTAVVNAIEAKLVSLLPGDIIPKYKGNLQKISTILEKIKSIVNENRNLGEDIGAFAAIRLQEIGLHSSIEIDPAADPVEIAGLILFNIETFFSPSPRFNSLSDLLSKKEYLIEELFDGPSLENGILPNKEFESLVRQKVVYVSDLVRIILNVSGTVAVRDIFLNSYFDNFKTVENERNCLRIKGEDRYKPKLSIARSNVILTRNGLPVNVDENSVLTKLNALRSAYSIVPVSLEKDLAIPLGRKLDWNEYYSVQYEFPSIYGIGNATLVNSSSPERIAQARQLRGYLLIFDQILANTFSQLVNIGDFFSIQQSSPQTYYFQTLYQVPEIEDLLGHLADGDSWANFIASIDNKYLNLLRTAGESSNIYFQRRNLILDHLLSRIAENRDEYSALNSTLYGTSSKEITLHEKAGFLEAYTQLSKQRAQAFNYKATLAGVPDVWDTTNVGGYVSMVSKKLGFTSNRRRSLFNPISLFFEFFNVVVGAQTLSRFRLKDSNGNILLIGTNNYNNDTEALEGIKILLQIGSKIEFYSVEKTISGTYFFKVSHPVAGPIGEAPVNYTQKADVEAAIASSAGFIGEKYSLEGIHVVEHILLRPQIKGAIPTDNDKLFSPLEVDNFMLSDPYSNVVTVVIPSGFERNFSIDTAMPQPAISGYRLRHPEFALFCQKTILQEAPAHLLVNVFSLDINTSADLPDTPSLQNFEKAFKIWLETNSNPASTDAARKTALSNFILVLEKMYES